MTNTPDISARIIPEIEARIISQKLECLNDVVSDFACEAPLILRELKAKLENPTRENLPAIRADINALIENQRMIQSVDAIYRPYLHELKDRFNRSFTILDVLKGDPENANNR